MENMPECVKINMPLTIAICAGDLYNMLIMLHELGFIA